MSAEGRLRLEIAVRDGLTEVVRQYQRAPLQAQPPIYSDPQCPGMAWVYMLLLGGGVLQGDRLRTDIRVCPGAQVHLTTPAATLLYRSPAGPSHHAVTIQAEADSYVEYFPGAVIPFRGARYFETVSLVADPGASLAFGSVVSAGRTAMNELHAYDRYTCRLTARDRQGNLLFLDTTDLEPERASPVRPGLLGRFTVWGGLHLLSSRCGDKSFASAVLTILHNCGTVKAGISELPSGTGLSVRVLGTSMEDVAGVLHATLGVFRSHTRVRRKASTGSIRDAEVLTGHELVTA
jgi:urease accessory protein